MELIVVHCSASPNGRSVTAPDIDAWHYQRGFRRSMAFRERQNINLAAIGYHFVGYVNGAIATGRHLDEVGAHTNGHNRRSLGYCLIGTDAYTPAQWESLKAWVWAMRHRYPEARIVGHRDLSPDLDGDGVIEPQEWLKTCPGFDVAEWLAGNMAPLAGHVLEGTPHTRSFAYDPTPRGAR